MCIDRILKKSYYNSILYYSIYQSLHLSAIQGLRVARVWLGRRCPPGCPPASTTSRPSTQTHRTMAPDQVNTGEYIYFHELENPRRKFFSSSKVPQKREEGENINFRSKYIPLAARFYKLNVYFFFNPNFAHKTFKKSYLNVQLYYLSSNI